MNTRMIALAATVIAVTTIGTNDAEARQWGWHHTPRGLVLGYYGPSEPTQKATHHCWRCPAKAPVVVRSRQAEEDAQEAKRKARAKALLEARAKAKAAPTEPAVAATEAPTPSVESATQTAALNAGASGDNDAQPKPTNATPTAAVTAPAVPAATEPAATETKSKPLATAASVEKAPAATTTAAPAAKPADCKLFVPTVGMTISVPCQQ